MSDEIDTLRRENALLKRRVAQLQDDITDITADAARLRQRLEIVAERPPRPPSPLGGD